MKKPERVDYPHQNRRLRHYGSNVHKLIEKALTIEDDEKRAGFAYIIGSYMKLAYKTWNKEHYVSDDIIKEDLESLSGGKLKLEDEASFKTPSFPSSGRGRRGGRSRDNRGRSGHRRSNGGRSGGRGRGRRR